MESITAGSGVQSLKARHQVSLDVQPTSIQTCSSVLPSPIVGEKGFCSFGIGRIENTLSRCSCTKGALTKCDYCLEEPSFLKSGTKSESDLEELPVGEVTTGKTENIQNAGKFPGKNATDVIKPSTSCSIPIRCFSQDDELEVVSHLEDKSASIQVSSLSQGHTSKPSQVVGISSQVFGISNQVVGISNQTAEPAVCCCSAKQAEKICTCQSGKSSLSASVPTIRRESGETVRKRTEKCESIVQDKKRCLRSKTMKMRSATVVKTRSSSVLPVSQMSAEQVLKHCPKLGQEIKIVYQSNIAMSFEYVCLSVMCSS